MILINFYYFQFAYFISPKTRSRLLLFSGSWSPPLCWTRNFLSPVFVLASSLFPSSSVCCLAFPWEIINWPHWTWLAISAVKMLSEKKSFHVAFSISDYGDHLQKGISRLLPLPHLNFSSFLVFTIPVDSVNENVYFSEILSTPTVFGSLPACLPLMYGHGARSRGYAMRCLSNIIKMHHIKRLDWATRNKLRERSWDWMGAKTVVSWSLEGRNWKHMNIKKRVIEVSSRYFIILRLR